MVFFLSAPWWRRIRGFWRLPDGRDWLRGKLSLVLIGGALLSKTLIQFSVEGWGCVPFLLLDLRPNYVGCNEVNEKRMKTLLYLVLPTLQHATTDPHFCCRPLDTHRQVWVYILWGQCSFLLGPGSHNILSMPSKSVFPQSCVSSGGSMMGLMGSLLQEGLCHTQVYCTQSPCPCCRPLPTYTSSGHSDTVLSQSLGPAAHKLCLSLWASLAGMGLNVICTLLPTCWGFFFALGHGITPQNLSGAMQPLLQHLPSCWLFHGYTQKS